MKLYRSASDCNVLSAPPHTGKSAVAAPDPVRDCHRFRAIFEQSNIGFAVLTADSRFAEANASIERMFGYSAGQLRGVTHASLLHQAYRDANAAEEARLMAGTISIHRAEQRYVRRTGEAFWARLTAWRVPGERPEIIALIEDIAERKAAEEELAVFRAIVEESHEAIAVFSPKGGGILHANPAHERLFHHTLRDRPGTTYRDFYVDESVAVIHRKVEPALRRGESWEGVLDAKDARGRIFPLWQRIGVAQDCDGDPRFFFGFMHDHSRQKHEENELHRAKKVAEQANQAKTRFLAAASHDLRQPLQALAMFVAVLANRDHTPANQAIIDRIQDSVTAVEGLLNSLLDVSKLEAGLVVPSVENFAVGPMLQRLRAEFEPLAEAAGLELRMALSTATVRSDPTLLERILRNLLNNAVRYTQTGTVLFGCRRRAGHVCIQVCDTGIGIPTNQLKLIFREFHQLANPNRDRRQGLGLGLAIVERLAALLGHRIDVLSSPQKGSMFSVEVPVGWMAAPDVRPHQLALDIAASMTTILVIDDEPDVLDGIRLLLESWGYTVITANDCDEALGRLADLGGAPDLIIADYRLRHGSTGGQAIARIQIRLRKPIPAIILTGDTAPERLRLARASGHGLLHKPVQPACLRAAITQVLEGRGKARPVAR